MNEYDELIQTQEKERADLKKEIEIKKLISEKTEIPFKVFLGGIPSYGYTQGIHFKDLFREDNLTKAELIELIDLFKPLKMFKVSDSCTSFMPISKEGKLHTEVSPYIINLDTDAYKIKIEWFSMINGQVTEIQAYINNREFINKFLFAAYNRVECRGGFRIEDCRCKGRGNFSGYKVIKWGTGGEQYANDFTLYTDNLKVDFKELIQKD